jgi:hypothetical protein
LIGSFLCGQTCARRLRRCDVAALSFLALKTQHPQQHNTHNTTHNTQQQQYLSREHAKAVSGNNSQGPVYKIQVRLALLLRLGGGEGINGRPAASLPD